MSTPSFILRLNGTLLSPETNDLPQDSTFRVEKAIALDALNRGLGTEQKHDLTDTLIRLEGEDDFEWVGFGDDLPDLYAKPAHKSSTRGESGEEIEQLEFVLPGDIQARDGGQRGIIDNIKLKALQILGKRAAQKINLARELGKRLDAHLCPQPKLYRVVGTGQLEAADKIATDKPALLILHGTISSFSGGFSGIDEKYWQKLRARYGKRIFAYNHRTITDSPVKNALELLAALPSGMELDLLTHSRGGIIGDVLARCDQRLGQHLGYSAAEIKLVRNDAREGKLDGPIADEMQTISRLAAQKKLTIRRIVRVACPAQGTTLLSKRIDHYLNAALNLLKSVSGPAAPVVGILREFIMHVVDGRTHQGVFPGLYAMTPESAFQKVNQTERLSLPSSLVSIAGDSEVGGGLKKSFFVVLSNLYYWKANDFVVDTASMVRGMPKRKAHFSLTIESDRIDHFSYFDESDYMKAVSEALVSDNLHSELIPGHRLNNELIQPSHRGVVVDGILRLGELMPTPVTGTKPIVVLLPGIMGSNLYVAEEIKWMRATALQQGALVDDLDIEIQGSSVDASSAIAKYYAALVEHLQEAGFDVSLFPYDWRKPLSDSAGHLHQQLTALRAHNQPIQLLAHSMGGLVVRHYMFDKHDEWRQLQQQHGTRIVLLGTPWRGSHLITEVITGHSRRIRQLHLLDFKHSKTKVIETVAKFPGVQQLLPLDTADTIDEAQWQRLIAASGRRVPQLPTNFVDNVIGFRESVKTGLATLKEKDYEAIIYVAGQAPKTVDGYTFKYKSFWGKEVLRYTTTARGDGSVTWEKGIPQQLSQKQVYYTRTQHGELASDKKLFDGLVDLLYSGKTSNGAFSSTPPAVGMGQRGQSRSELALDRYESLISTQTPEDILFGIEEHSDAQGEELPVRLEVFNGDLKWAAYPVMVGHFENDGIVSAENAIDNYLGGVLRERHQMGFYPGKIGEHEVIINTESNPNGTVVVGLGDKDGLTGSLLTKTVEKGLLKYSLFYRDNKIKHKPHAGDGHGISILLIGSNYGQLPLQESLRSIVNGVHGANALIKSFNDRAAAQGKSNVLHPIGLVEFVDYYEDRAFESHKLLKTMYRSKEIGSVVLASSITEGFGSRQRFLREGSRSWWQTMTTIRTQVNLNELANHEDPDQEGRQCKQEILRFNTSNRTANVKVEEVFGNLPLALEMARQMSTHKTFKQGESKVLFEMLIPNRFKDFIRNHRNLVWRMDRFSAQFPWELFHDSATGMEPTFVQAGMIRQLFSQTANIRPALVREMRALVIGDPILGEDSPFRQLPGAEAEAELAVRVLQNHGFDVVTKIKKRTVETVSALYAKPYKVIHIAAHGVFQDANGQSGIVLEGDSRITPGMFRQLSAIPELVVINACYLGEIDEKHEALLLDRHRLAANIGTQLIENGVKAVVVAGWAVDDEAAKVFAERFYTHMLAGQYFGDAVRLARKACWKFKSSSNTWGAYQCYGDQFYLLTNKGGGSSDYEHLSLEQEVVLELKNLVSTLRNVRSMAEISNLRKEASSLLARAKHLDIQSPEILENEALLFKYLGNYERAIQSFNLLFEDDRGLFQVRSYINKLGLEAREYAALAISSPEIMPFEEAAKKLDDLVNELQNHEISNEGVTIKTQIASIYKRAAAVSDGRDQALKFLDEGIKNYAEAARELGFDSASAIYALSNVLTLSAFAKTDPERFVEDEIGLDVEAHFKRWEHRDSYMAGERNSPYALLREANYLQCKLIWKLVVSKEIPDKELNVHVDKLLEAHRRQRKIGFNLRDLRGQAENYQILLRLLDLLNLGTKTQREQLKRLHDFTSRDPSGNSIYQNWSQANMAEDIGPTRGDGESTEDSGLVMPGDGGGSAPESANPSEKSTPAPPYQLTTKAESTHVFAKGFEKELEVKDSDAQSFCVEEGPGELLIRSHKIDLSEPGTRGGQRDELIRIELPKDARVALIEFDYDAEEKSYAWVPLEQAEQVRGFGVAGQFFEIQLTTSGERGLGKGLKKLFKGVKRFVVDFYRSARGFVNKELRNHYDFQVLNLLGDGRVVYETVRGDRAFAEATQGADRSLLMLHGMFNTAKGTFKDLVNVKKTGKVEPRFGKLLTQRYGGRALIMNMPTIFRSFRHNADTFPLRSVQAKTLDVMANSRGTNVARELVLRLGKQGVVNRGQTFLAGGPAFGTPLADKDHMLTLVNVATTILRAAGKPLGPVVPILLHLVEQASKRVLSGEGLVDMAPGSQSLKILNEKWDFNAKDVQYVGSNYEPTKETKKLLGRLTDAALIDKAIMKGIDNDGVIPTAGTLGLTSIPASFRSSKTRYRVPQKDEIGHFMYYQHDEVVKRLVGQFSASSLQA